VDAWALRFIPSAHERIATHSLKNIEKHGNCSDAQNQGNDLRQFAAYDSAP
jgi:hypothetical protein